MVIDHASDYEDYERFVSSLIRDIRLSGRDIGNISWGRNNKINGASGQPHQIDVSFWDCSFQPRTLVIIECKRHKDPVELSTVKIAKATLDDISIENSQSPTIAMVVSTSRFRSGAKRFGDYYGIMCIQLTHGPPYQFRYENYVLNALVDKGQGLDVVTVYRSCSCCGADLVKERNSSRFFCSNCNQR